MRAIGILILGVLLVGCANGEGRLGAAALAYPVAARLDGVGAVGVRVLLREGEKGRYVVVVHRAGDKAGNRGGRLDVTLWVEGEAIEVMRGVYLGPWESKEGEVELPGSPRMVNERGGMRLVLVRGEEKLSVGAVVEGATAATTRSGDGVGE